MEKPNRHIWEEDSTHRSVAGYEYDEVWDYAARLEAELDGMEQAWDDVMERERVALEQITILKAENERLRKLINKYRLGIMKVNDDEEIDLEALGDE